MNLSSKCSSGYSVNKCGSIQRQNCPILYYRQWCCIVQGQWPAETRQASQLLIKGRCCLLFNFNFFVDAMCWTTILYLIFIIKKKKKVKKSTLSDTFPSTSCFCWLLPLYSVPPLPSRSCHGNCCSVLPDIGPRAVARKVHSVVGQGEGKGNRRGSPASSPPPLPSCSGSA